jgi:hypothetical protein
MQRLPRYLRIAFSVTCLLVCALLIVFWVRSYRQIDFLRLGGHKILCVGGKIQIDKSWSTRPIPSGHWQTNPGDSIETLWKTTEVQVSIDSGITVPFWLPTVLAMLFAIGAAPWVPWRFSLRTLLIAMTLIAGVLGTIVYVKK